MSLVFNKVGNSKSGLLTKYEPAQGSFIPDWTRLYILEQSGLQILDKLVLLPTHGREDADFIWESNGSSKRFNKFKAVETGHCPAIWNGKAINQLYIPKDNPMSDLDELCFIVDLDNLNEDDAFQRLSREHDVVVKKPKPHTVAGKVNAVLKIRQVIEEGLKRANTAAKEQMAKLEAQGPRYDVKDAFTGITHGSILDNCGGAWIAGMDGRSLLGKTFKKMSKGAKRLFAGDKRHNAIHTTHSQYVSVAKAESEAFCKYVNETLNTELYVWTYLD